MFLWILKQIILSLIIIILIHYLYVFFKTNLTVPKIKDLVNRPVKKYKEIYKSLEREKAPPPPSGNMKIELKNYLQSLGNNDIAKPAPSTPGNNIFNNHFQTF